MMSKSAILQNCIFFSEGLDRALFASAEARCSINVNRIEFTGEGTVDLDTMFNCFFVAPWQAWTTLGTIEVEVEFSGTLEISVLLHCSDSDDDTPQIASTIFLQPPEHPAPMVWRSAIADLASNIFKGRGRISLRLSGKAGTTVTALRFVTPDQPLREVRLSLGICSFNRPQNIEAVLRSFSAQKHSAVSHLIVVDQGNDRIHQGALNKIVLPEGLAFLHLVQGNFGGSGGFTRSILKAMELAEQAETGPTHHVMMDDDAIAHPDQWTRIAAFFAFCREACAVGGPMLELETPWRLHEAGIIFPKDQRRRSIGRGLDVRQSSARDRLHQPLDIDAHGWWCWGAPIDVFEQCGAPLNLFIKYDDVEYTYRLKKMGIHTAVLPGASVFHEAFAHKPSDWRTYYTLRNEAIFQALHDPTPAWRSSPVWNSVIPPILRHDPVTAHLAMDALDDFLSGPTVAMPADPTGLHQRVISRYKDLVARYADSGAAGGFASVDGKAGTAPTQPSDWQTARTRTSLFARLAGCQLRFLSHRRQAQARWRTHLQAEMGRDRHASYAAWRRLFSAAAIERTDA